MVVPYEEFSDNMIPLIIQTVSMSILLMVTFAIGCFFIHKMKNKKDHKLITYFSLYLWTFLIGTTLIIIPIYLFIFTDPNYPNIIRGIPIGNGMYFWWSNVCYIFLSVGNYYMFKINTELSGKKNKVSLIIFLIIVGIFNVWNVYYGIYVYSPGAPSLSLGMSGLLLVMNLWVWVQLTYTTGKLRKALSEKTITKAGISMVYFSSLLTIVSYLVSVISVLYEPMRMIVWYINIITSIMLYIGFGHPKWFKKYLKKRNYNEK